MSVVKTTNAAIKMTNKDPIRIPHFLVDPLRGRGQFRVKGWLIQDDYTKQNI
jgi:hypothetical protein